MGIPSELRDMWIANKNTSLQIASPAEEQKMLRSSQCTAEGVRAGFKAAGIGCVTSTGPTLVAVRMIPWAKANLNYTAQALIISAVSVASFFVAADKIILACARKQSLLLEESLKQERCYAGS
ncbi:putative early nodulin 93 ENOD93 protein [Medicago truncatula]|uniref:Early nodulin 93 n=1 Tax=Medicago truncatula TaxID=3880 RepID=A0A072V2K9_MEDTR|nr:early nodulin-93 isoform X1 [Medicago truncatula]KEH36097.1 early nodulin 93 [Medicago truncatula]RHN70910.1 putative early nodulin 93 ENOD93 protein [Medicago truncatula]